MLKLENITLHRGSKLLLRDVSFQVHAGQCLGLLGANGSGKSSLFAMLLGELEADAGDFSINPGAVIAHVSQQSPTGTRAALEYVIDGDSQLRDLQAQIALAEQAEDHQRLQNLYPQLETMDGYTAGKRAARLLHGLGFAPDETEQPVNSFSGGWRMRLNLARALMCRSDILLLDEPTNHLDLPAILWLERWLQRYPGILLLVSHDRDFLDAVCTRIAAIESQTIRLYAGNYSQYERQRAERLAMQQAGYRKQQAEIKHIQAFVDRFRYKASKAKQAQARLKMLERMTRIAPAHVDSPFHFRFFKPEKIPLQLLTIEAGRAGYSLADEEREVIREFDFRINAGDRIGLLGANGAGKSTLVKALADGSTLLAGNRELARDCRIGYFAQHQLEQLQMDESPLWHIEQLEPEAGTQELLNFLGGFDFRGEQATAPVAPLSGGEKSRLALALIIWQRPNLLLLDEPTNHLDMEMRQALSLALAEYEGALLVISHDRHLLRSVCDTLVTVHDHQILPFDGDLDGWSAWIREQHENFSGKPGKSDRKNGRQRQRRHQAESRKFLRPYKIRVRKAESLLEKLQQQQAALEARLLDEGLYTRAGRKTELQQLLGEQARLRQSMQAAELDWLQAAGRLEAAEQELQAE